MTLTGQEVAEVSHVDPRQFRAYVAIVSMFGSSIETFLPVSISTAGKLPGFPLACALRLYGLSRVSAGS